jgi:hypothetical protein
MIFDDVVIGGETLLREAILIETPETLRLDFKESAVGKPGALFSDGRLTKDGRRAIAKALSAFSNSAGGLVVIGVDCRAGSDGIDIARSLDPIPRWKAALDAVSSAVRDLLQPENDSVRVAGFPSEKTSSAGYLVIDVPRSERRPHMCNMTKRYFKRIGSASYAMEHFDVEDAFRRATTPDIVLELEFARRTISRSLGEIATASMQIRLGIRNIGAVTAKMIVLQLGKRTGGVALAIGEPYTPPEGNQLSNYADQTSIIAPRDFVVHPGQTRFLEFLSYTLNRDDFGNRVVENMPLSKAFVALPYSLGAENMPLRDDVLKIDAGQLWGDPPFLDRR